MNLNNLFSFSVSGWDKPWFESHLGAYKIKANGRKATVAFRYSSTGIDWLTDFFAWPINGIHSGFAASYFSLIKSLVEDIKDCDPEEIVFTGFSKGGALAQIANEDQIFTCPTEAIVFGAPKSMVKKGTGRSTRYEVGGDIVPRMPPLWYTHVGARVRLDWKIIPRFSAHKPSVYRAALIQGGIDGNI